MVRASDPKSAFWKARTSSGSRRSDSEVKPVRSAKRTVTWRRSASGPSGAAGGGAGFGAAVGTGGGAAAGAGPAAGPGAARGAPQRGQNANPGDASKPQPAQVIRSPV